MKGPSLEQLLRYERHLDGEAFTRNVLAVTARRRWWRSWILTGAVVSAVTAAIAIKPDKFTFFSSLHLPLQSASETMATLPVGGLLAMLLVSLLMAGSKALNTL